MLKQKNPFRRGDIYLADLSPAVGSEQGGKRPVLIVQNDVGNLFSTTVIVAPITSQDKGRNLPTHVPLSRNVGLEHDSMVLLEQLRTLDVCRFEKFITRLNGNQMEPVNHALLVSIGLVSAAPSALRYNRSGKGG